MKFKRLCAALLALVMCVGTISTTAFAYSDESAAVPDAETVETVPEETEETEEQTSEDEVPYTVTVNEDSLSMVKNGLTAQRNPRIITWEPERWLRAVPV